MFIMRRDRLFGLILALVALGCITGCQHSIEIKEKSPGSEAFTPVPDDPNRIPTLAYVKTVKVIVDGTEGSPSNALLYRFRTKLLETKLFHDVIFQNPYAPYVELNLINLEGKTKSYNARSTATLNAPAGDPKFMENTGSKSPHSDLYLTVFNNVINSLMSQMIQDADLIMYIRKEIRPKSDS